MSKTLAQSKTVQFNLIMAGIEALHGGLAIMEPIMAQDTFAIVTLIIGVIHSMGGVYLRTITSTPISKNV